MGVFNTKTDMHKITHEKAELPMGIKSGIYALDDAIWGLQPSEICVIGGRPGMGKSSLARQILMSAGSPETNKGVGILFTMEMPSEMIATLMTSTYAKVDHEKVKRGTLTDNEKTRFEQANAYLSTCNCRVVDDSYVTPSTVSNMIKQCDEPISCVIIDYLQLMYPDKIVETRALELQKITREMKVLAMEYKIPIVLLSQLNRASEGRDSGRPRKIDLRESGAIENDATTIVLLHRQSVINKEIDSYAVDDGEAELIVCKQRYGATCNLKCAYIAEYTYFCDMPDMEEF